MRFSFVAAVAALGLPLSCLGLLERQILTFDDDAVESALDITSAPIICADDDFKGIHIAVSNLATDLSQITSTERETRLISDVESLAETGLESAIIVGSLNSSLIQLLVKSEILDVTDLEGKWESFQFSVVDKPLDGIERALIILGSDKRGAIFGVYTLAEQAGQSPYHWFTDVPTKKHDSLRALAKSTLFGEPSVKYRGLFINDEQPALTNWWARFNNATTMPLNTDFYAHVFDLLLRLKANFLWPAMWRSSTPPPGNIFFTDDPQNQALADEYGIVISTAHHEPMQRATNEWDESEMGPWDWSKNKENITAFMEEGVRRAGNNESYFTIGLRGLGDEAANTENAIEMLKDVFEVQRGILKKYHGDETAVNQVWALYKEVASYYDAGLDPPEDVTLLFPDDNWGNVYRLPTGDEANRKGGNGVYYHFEYVGLPRSYKWANTNNLAKVLKELSQSYERGADRIWIVNVGDIKPMELPFQLSMDLAWDVSSITFDTLSDYIRQYAAREFTPTHADEIAEILLEHSHLIGMRRYELVTPDTYSTLNFHEAERILQRWQAIEDKSVKLYDEVAEELRPAFFELVYHPVVSGSIYHAITIGQGRNYRYALERRNAANEVAGSILNNFERSYDLNDEYDSILDGKWMGMMSQAVYDVAWQEPKSWAGPARDMLANISYVQLRQNMQFSLGNLGIQAEESVNAIQQGRWAESVDFSMPTTNHPALLPVMDMYGVEKRYVDLFHRGDYRTIINWKLDEVPFEWLTIDPSIGMLFRNRSETRLAVSVDWSKVPDGFDETVEVGITASPSRYPYFDIIRIPVVKRAVPEDFAGFPETAGMISIEGPHYQRSSANSSDPGSVSFEKFPHLASRSESGSISVRPFKAARDDSSAEEAWVEYNIYLFDGTEDLEATVYINGCLDTDPKLRMQFSLTLDDAPSNFTRVLGDYITNPYAGDIPPEWMNHVADQVWTKTVSLGKVEAGNHVVRWAVNSPEVYLEKIVLAMKGNVPASYLGPPETKLLGSK